MTEGALSEGENQLDILRLAESRFISEFKLEPWTLYDENVEQKDEAQWLDEWLSGDTIPIWRLYPIVWDMADYDDSTKTVENFDREFTLLSLRSYFMERTREGVSKDDLFAEIQLSLWMCRLIRYSEKIRKHLSLEVNIEELNGIISAVAFSNDRDKIIQYMAKRLENQGIDNHISIKHRLENSHFFKTIEGYYSILNSRNGIRYYARNTGHNRWSSYGEFGVGYFDIIGRPVEGIYRLAVINSLFEQIFRKSDIWGIIRSLPDLKDLSELMELGEEIIENDIDSTLLESFSIEDEIIRFHKFSMTAFLLTNENTNRIIEHCKKLETNRHVSVNDSLEQLEYHSVKIRDIVFHSNFDKDMQEFSTENLAIFRTRFDQDNAEREKKGRSLYKNSLAEAAWMMKQNLKKFSQKIASFNEPRYGVGAFTRKRDYDKDKINHLKIYNLLKINTKIPQENKGRPIEILYPRQNKNLKNIKKELDFLPESLELVFKRFDDIPSIVKVPYMVLITFDHFFQYTRCAISLEDNNFNESFGTMSQRLRTLHQYIAEFDVDGFDWIVEIRDLIYEEDENENRITWDRKFMIRLQHLLATNFLEIEQELNFPFFWFDGPELLVEQI